MTQRRDVLKAAGAAAGAMTLPSAFAQGLPVIERDVCVVGGGSAGTYTAVRLRDLGRSVVVIERQGRLGGHAETFTDTASGTPIDIGVVVLENNPLVNAYLARFGVTGVPIQFPPGDTRYVDFRSGRVVEGYAPPERTALGLFAYQRVLASRFPYLDQGFVLPDPVPPDLWLPTRAFIQKYRLDAIVPTLWDFGQGIGNLLEVPALYTLKLVGLSVMNAILGIDGSGFLLLPQGTSQLYLAATAALGSDLLLNTSVRRASRSDGGVELVVDTPQGPALVRARKLVVAIPPTLSNLAGFGLDPLESTTFGRLRPQCYATAVVRLSGLPAGVSLRNTGADTEFNLPPLPGLYGLTPTGAPGLWNLKYGAAGPLPADTLRQNIRDDLARVASAGTFPLVLESIEIFKDHTPFQMMVSTKDIAAGYYRTVESLQGRSSTWFHSAAFQTNNSSRLWQRTEALLPQIAA